MLRPLALARLGVILFPRKARLLPGLVDRGDQNLPQIGVELLSAGLVRTFLLGDILVRAR